MSAPGVFALRRSTCKRSGITQAGNNPSQDRVTSFFFFSSQSRPSGQQGHPGGLRVFFLGGAKKLHSTRPLFFAQQIAYGTDFLKNSSGHGPPFNHFWWFSCCFCSVAGIVLVFSCFLQMISLLFLRPWCVFFSLFMCVCHLIQMFSLLQSCSLTAPW